MSLERYSAANFRIPFRISWLVILTVIASILLCQFTESVTGRQTSTPHGKKHCLKNLRRSMPNEIEMITQIVHDAALTPQDILSRLETAAVLRDNLVTALGRVLLLCLDDDARVPFERVHDAVRTRRVAAYELLQILPVLRGETSKQQLYRLLQMLERVDNRFVSEYASLCISVFSDLNADLEETSLGDMLRNIDPEVIESISRDKYRTGAVPLSLTKSVDFVLRAARDDNRFLNLHTVSAILLNHPEFDLTDPEVPNAMRFLARQMKERSRVDDPLLQYADTENATNLLRTVLDRLEVDLQSSVVIRDAASLLLQYLGAESYPRAPSWKSNPKKLLTLGDHYPVSVTVVAKHLADRLDESHFRDLDIGFYETGDHALLQVLSRLRRKPDLQHLRKPLSLLMPFVSQKLMSEADLDYPAPISFFEVSEYLDSFDTPCLQQNISDAMKTLRPHLTENLPWSYAFGNRRMSDDPWELTLNALIHLRNFPISKPQATAIDNFVYKSRTNRLTGRREPLYESGIIFQRDDSTDVELDFFSLLSCIPDIFKSEKFAPMLNFFSKPNLLDVLGYRFNKFEHDTPRNLLLALLKRALALPFVKSDKSLSKTLQNARDYLEEPLLINLYTSEDLQLLLKQLPGIDSDPRYLPLKFLFNKHQLFAYLSPTFSLAGLHTPMEKLSSILKTVSLKVTQPKLAEALKFALENIDEPPLPVKPMDRDDFVYLTRQLLSRNKTLEQFILKSYAYIDYPVRESWNISLRGTPETILARFLNNPTFFLNNDADLGNHVKQATSILEDEDLVNIEILKRRTLEAMLEHLPSSTYVKPVNLLLRKANLMTFVPKLNLALLENVGAREALITLLQNLSESRMIRAEKMLLRRVRATLSSLDGASAERQSPISVYLIQSLQDPSNAIYKPLLQEITGLQNVKTSALSEERQTWLQHYLQQIVAKNESGELTKAASTALREIVCDDILDEELRASKERIGEATSLLPNEFFAESLKNLLTPDWTYNILPEELRKSDTLKREELLLAILHYAKQRADIASNPALMRAIFKVETSLNKWRADVELLRNTVAALKAAVYDPLKNLLTASGLNTLKVAVPRGKSAKTSLLALLHRLLAHPLIKKSRKVFNLVSVVRQDVASLGIDVDLLTILDDMGIPYIDELAPIRLFLHKREVNLKFGRALFEVADREERYQALLNVLEQQHQMDNDTQFFNALSTLRNVQAKLQREDTLISDLNDIVNTIPHRVRERFRSIEHLFDGNILLRLTHNNEIVLSKNPLIALLSKIADLPEVRDNHDAASELNKMRSELVKSGSHQIVTGFQIRPLLRELRHVQRVNVDYLNFILDPEMLSYLNSDEFSDVPDDNAEVLRTVVDYLLHKGPGYADHYMRKNLQSIERAMTLMTNSTPKLEELTKEDWKKMLILIPHEKKFTPIRLFLQSGEISAHVSKNIDWKMFSTPLKKLLQLLSIVKNSDVENDNVFKSADALRDYLEERFNFISEEDVKSMHYTLANLKLKGDLVPLKIFLNHDNMIKYLPSNFRYANYSAPNDALAAVLDNLLKVPSLKRKVILYKTMTFVRQSLQSPSRRSFHKKQSSERLSSKDLEFVNTLSFSGPKIREFLQPEKLMKLLPESFTFNGRPIFKMKALHLLRELLKLDADVHAELEKLLRGVEAYPDVPRITKDDLVPLLNIFPSGGIPHIELVEKYLKPTALTKLLPGNFNIKQSTNAKVALHDLVTLLRDTLGSAKSDKLQIALDALLIELKKSNSDVILKEPIVDNSEIRSIIKEIPFDQYAQIRSLKSEMRTKKVVSSLPLNFQLTGYETKKLRVLAILDELSKSGAFQSSLASISLAKKIVNTMPDMPMVNDMEIERLLAPLPLDGVYVKRLIQNCKLAALAPYLPINFNLNSFESRKTKIATILQHCNLANSENVTTRQALTNAERWLKTSPDFDVTREHVESLISVIPCTHFTSIAPLLQHLSEKDVAPLLPWDLDVYETSQTFKQRVFSLLTALRNVKELQNKRMFSALDSLEMNAKSLPDEVTVPEYFLTILQNHQHGDIIGTELCKNYAQFTMRRENLIKILPPTYSFKQVWDSAEGEWTYVMHYSRLFEREVKIEGPMKKAFEACKARESIYAKDRFSYYIRWSLTNIPQFWHFVPLRLYVFGANRATLTAPIDDASYGHMRGIEDSFARTMVREFIRRPELTGSKSLIRDLENYLQDYMMAYHRDNPPSDREMDLAIGEIPSDRRYNNLRLLMRCPDIQAPILRKNLTGDGTMKQLLLKMLEQAEEGDIDEKIRDSIKTLKPSIEKGIREEEVEIVLKQMRDYRYHAGKIKGIRDYALQRGVRGILHLSGDYPTTYHSFKDRLVALTSALLNESFTQSNVLRAEATYLNRVLNNEIKIGHIIPRTMDDINVQSLIFALPKTRDERIIRGIIKFFSVPDLLRKLSLPKDPFDYVTKGRLLQAIMDLGQELEGVREDPVQQEALEYFRNRITTTGAVGAQPIELKKYAHDANVNVDMYGVMQAIDYAKVNETDAVEVATFLGHKYDNLVHAVGFDHMACATRGAYLKALFEHLTNVSQVPDDVKQRIALLLPAVRLDGPGDESVDLNDDVVVSAEAPSMRMFRRFLDDSQSRPVGKGMSNDFEEEKKSLETAVDNVLQTITSSEEKYLDRLTGQSNVYGDKTRIVIGSPQHAYGVRRKLDSKTIEHSAQNATNDFNSSLEEVKINELLSNISAVNNLTKSVNHAEVKKDGQLTRILLLDEINNIRFKIAKKIKSAILNDSNWRINSDRDSGDNDDSSITSDKHAVKSPQVLTGKLSSNKRSKKSRHIPHQTPHKSRRILIRPDSSLDVEYDNISYSTSGDNISFFRIFHDMLQRDKENSSLTKELMAEQAKHIDGKAKRKTVKKDLSRHLKGKKD